MCLIGLEGKGCDVVLFEKDDRDKRLLFAKDDWFPCMSVEENEACCLDEEGESKGRRLGMSKCRYIRRFLAVRLILHR